MTTTPNPGQDVVIRIAKWIKGQIEGILNAIFSLSHNAARNRDNIRWTVFIVLWIFWTYTLHNNAKWMEIIQPIIDSVIRPSEGNTIQQTPILLVKALFSSFLHATVIRHMLALIAPYFLWKRLAGIYVADVFEKEEQIGRSFITQASFGIGYNTIHIREGKIVEADQNSPIVQIGGPGYIMVELDSAVLFEKPDGTCNVIGPTNDQHGGYAVISGFERIRQCVDLRDTSDVTSVTARSRDGIMVTAKDIQFSYSIYRGENPKTLPRPYPFDPKALENMIFKTVRPVKPGQPPSRKPDWQTPLPSKIGGMVGGEFGGFISKRGLSEFLSSIGTPEEEALLKREENIDQQSQQLSGRNGAGPSDSPLKGAMFTSRTALTKMFYDDGGFKKNAAGKGIQVNWIGVGTWVTPEIIPNNHLEAWKLSRENIARGNPNTLNQLRNEIKLREQLRLLQNMPISRFFAYDAQTPDDKVIDDLLLEYQERLESARELYERDGDVVPQNILDAIRVLREIRGNPHHWVGVG